MTYLQWYKRASADDKAAVQALKAEETARAGQTVEARDIILAIMTDAELAEHVSA